MSSTIQRPLLTALLSAALAVSTARAEPPGPGSSDFTRTDPSAIQASDIIQAMSPARQTAIKAAETPAENAAGAPKGKRSHQVAPAPRDERPRVLLPIYFEFGSAEPTAESRKVLEAVGEALRSPELASGQFLIEGHTDAVGSAPDNQSLSVERAQTVEVFLEQRGVSADRLRFVGRGEAAPIATNDSEDGRQRNRRVELIRLSAND